MIKYVPVLKEVKLSKMEQDLMNNLPISFFETSDNLLINDGKIVGYEQVKNIAETYLPIF